MNFEEQTSLFDVFGADTEQESIIAPDSISSTLSLSVVDAAFKGCIQTDWKQLFSGYDELYAITFSSGVNFLSKVLDRFRYAEVIFGCEGVMNEELATIMSVEIECIRQLVKSKNARKIADRLHDKTLNMYVSRAIRSHEKIYILRADDGRTRVITGSANMSGQAFYGIQRENVLKFDDEAAYKHYKDIFEQFRESCADGISHKAVVGTMEDPEYLQDNVNEIPIVKAVAGKNIVLLDDPAKDPEPDIAPEIVVSVKGLEDELKPMLPKPVKERGKLLIKGETFKAFRRKYAEHREIEKLKRKEFPKLHVDFESRSVNFNGTPLCLTPTEDAIRSDVQCVLEYMEGFNSFHGDTEQALQDYFSFLTWYFATPFIPYLRLVANKNNYNSYHFPIYGVIYGNSNGGKTTFVKFLSKLMSGVPAVCCPGSDFTKTNIENLKRGCEGLPLIVDDVGKDRFNRNMEDIIKNDSWGLMERFVNYPAVVVTSNKIPSLSRDIVKRTVRCRINIKIEQNTSAAIDRKINESINGASVGLFGEYIRRMFDEVESMVAGMCSEQIDYRPDIFEISSKILVDIISSVVDVVPNYVRTLSYADYFGDQNVGRDAIQQICAAWTSEPDRFTIDKKRNLLTYRYPENGNMYQLAYLEQELPLALNARKSGSSIVMSLDEAQKCFGQTFKKPWFFRK